MYACKSYSLTNYDNLIGTNKYVQLKEYIKNNINVVLLRIT